MLSQQAGEHSFQAKLQPALLDLRLLPEGAQRSLLRGERRRDSAKRMLQMVATVTSAAQVSFFIDLLLRATGRRLALMLSWPLS